MGKASREKASRRQEIAAASKQLQKKSRFSFPAIMTLVSGVLVVGLFALVFLLNSAEKAPVQAPASTVVDTKTGAITIGNGENVYEEYFDFGCPGCGVWWNKTSEMTAEATKTGKLTQKIHPISILDNAFQGTEYSTRAANAAYCVAETDPNAVYGFMDMLFKNQPQEGNKGLDDAKLISLAKDAGAAKAKTCIEKQNFKEFVKEKTSETPSRSGDGRISTPTMLMNGEFIDPSEDFEALLAGL